MTIHPRVKSTTKTTGRVLGSASLLLIAALAAAGEEQQRQREIQEHTDALKELQPGMDIMFVRKA